MFEEASCPACAGCLLLRLTLSFLDPPLVRACTIDGVYVGPLTGHDSLLRMHRYSVASYPRALPPLHPVDIHSPPP